MQSLPQIKQEKYQQNLANYRKLRQTTILPLKIKMFYSMLENCLEKENQKVQNLIQISKDFQKKYKKLLSAYRHHSEQQKIRILYQTLKTVSSRFKTKQMSQKQSQKQSDCISSESDGLNEIKQIETTCKVKDTMIGITKWDKKCFKFSRKTMKIKFIGLQSKKQLIFNLKLYFIRKSQRHSKALILDAITPQIQNKISEIYFSFDNTILFDEIYEAIFSCISQNIAKQLLKLGSNQKDQQDEESTNTGGGDMGKASTILTTKVLNEYFEQKDKIIRKLHNCSYSFEKVETNLTNTKIGISTHKQKTRIKIQKIYHQKYEQLSKKLSLISQKKNRNLVEFQILQKFSANINIAYFKYIFNGQIYEFLTIMEQNFKPQVHNLIFKGIDNFINKQFVDFISLSVKKQNQTTFLQLVGIVKSQVKKKKKVIDFLLSLVQPTKQFQDIENQQQFWTVRNFSDNIQLNDPNQQSQNMEQHIQENSNQMNEKYTQQYQQQLAQSCKFYEINRNQHMKMFNRNFRYVLDPTIKKQSVYMKQHYLQADWRLSKSGGFVCTNQQQINQQKKVFKWIISQLRKNVFKRKSILNMSLPVIIFRDQSHMKSCARNLAYAPIFLEKAINKSPLQRIKQAVLLHISMSNLIISMNKPFNPIIGQTYQGYIDGCPIFSQQISHHPPVTRFIFYGRGYKIYGIMQPKIALGLNCCKGWSPHPNYIEFDDGQIIEYTNNKMIINGILFGERSFAFQGQNYVIDRKNKIGAQIIYKSQTNVFFKKNDSKHDEVIAQIFKTAQNLDKESSQTIKRQSKNNLMVIDGVWHSKIRVDGKVQLDFQTFLPHTIQDHPSPIPSDSTYREDIKALSKGNVEQAQKQKDFLEDIQRNDKKLRQAYQAQNQKYLSKQM